MSNELHLAFTSDLFHTIRPPFCGRFVLLSKILSRHCKGQFAQFSTNFAVQLHLTFAALSIMSMIFVRRLISALRIRSLALLPSIARSTALWLVLSLFALHCIRTVVSVSYVITGSMQATQAFLFRPISHSCFLRIQLNF